MTTNDLIDEKTDKVTGHLVELSGGRLVFIGDSPDRPGTKFFAFRNEAGDDTKLTFSEEAIEAIRKILNEPFNGKRVHYPHKFYWAVVEGEDER